MMSVFVGIDFGEKRIGVAVSDEQKKIAFPLGVIHREKGSYGLRRLKILLAEKDIDRFVVGLPVRSDGSVGAFGDEVGLYRDALSEYFHKEVVTWDERYTTVIAESLLRDGGAGAQKSRRVVDKLAAQLILQSYLDHKNR
jgi:putative Holliday junction resolvase